MKPYRFTLQSIRVLRGQKERAAQERYAAALVACDRAAKRLNDAAAELAAGWDLLSGELANGAPACRLASTRAWCVMLELRRDERKAALQATRSAAQVAFQEMIAATQDREALDSFYQKSKRAFDREAGRIEQKNLDELAVQRPGNSGPLHLARSA